MSESDTLHMENMVRDAMTRLDSLMDESVNHYREARKTLTEKKELDAETLFSFDREWLMIIERLGVSIADMYRLIEKKNPA